jgi:hypothetical protein
MSKHDILQAEHDARAVEVAKARAIMKRAADDSAIRSAVLDEIAQWYCEDGWRLQAREVPAAIRALGLARNGEGK